MVSDVTLDCSWCTDEFNWTRSQWYPMLHLIVQDVQMRLTEQDDSGIWCYTWLNNDVQMRLTKQDHSGIWCYTWLNKMYSGIQCYTWLNKMTVVSDITLNWTTSQWYPMLHLNWTRWQWYLMLHLIAHDVQMRWTEQDHSGIQCYTWLHMMYSGIWGYTWLNKMTVVSNVTLDCTWCTDEVNWTRSQW